MSSAWWSLLSEEEHLVRLFAKDKEGELTPKKLLKVSHRLDKKSDIRKLGLQLGVEDYAIETILTNKKDDIEEAVYVMLKEWRKGQRNNREAYINLWAALTHPDVNLQSVAHEALESDRHIVPDYWDVQRRRQQEEIRRVNGRNTNHYETPESGIYESHPDEDIQHKRLRLEEEDEDLIPVRPKWFWESSLMNRLLLDEHLEEIAAKLDKDDIHRLGKQLEIPSTDINRILAKHCSSRKDAIHFILRLWLRRQENRYVAYIRMGEALIHPDVGLNLIATKVLHYPPAKHIASTRRKLKNKHIKKLSTKLSKDEMYRLGRKLGVSRNRIDAMLAQFSTTPEAICHVLCMWLKRQKSRKKAYSTMREALIHPDVGLNLIATEVLGNSPSDQ